MEVPAMSKAMWFVGLDVHVASVEAFAIDIVSGEVRGQRLSGRIADVVGWCVGLPVAVRAVYEAGPTGFGLARALTEAGVDVTVCRALKRDGRDRIKTDRRDAEKLCRALIAGDLAAVRVPPPAEEGLRDLVRAREDVRRDLMSVRHRTGKLLLRHDVRFEEAGGNWTVRHREWLGRVKLPERGSQLALADTLGAIDALVARRDQLERHLAALIPGSPWAQDIARLRCLRGIDTLTAAGLCAEIGDFHRFQRAGQLMSFVGLVPSEHSSGSHRRQGAITKTGSGHARRLVEAAWQYRRRPARGIHLRRRQDGQPPQILRISWQAQQRLHHLWNHLADQRGKRRTLVATAAARELAGFCWAITTTDQ
jgi:transposase